MVDFVHLHNHSDYSLLDGAARISDLAGRAAEYGMKHLALTDHGNMFGALNFYNGCREAGINPIVGCEFYVSPESRHLKSGSEQRNRYHHFLALAKDETGYRNLIKLTSLGYTEGFYYKPRIDDELLQKHSAGLIATSACLNGEIPSYLLQERFDEAWAKALEYRNLFGEGNFYLELQDHGIKEQHIANRGLIELSKKSGIPLIATNDVHYTDAGDANAQDILICIGTNKKKDDANRMKFSANEFYLKTPTEMSALFAEYPDAIRNTMEVAEKCNLSIPMPGPLFPDYQLPGEFESPDEYLKHLAIAGLGKRYGSVTEEIERRALYELDTIASMGFTGYFLIVWDFIRYALERDIPVGPGRGSGAGSIVAYALNITNIEPLKYGLLFERFLNPERVSMPDFDIDFCFERRGEVINYVTEKYGADRVGQIITFGRLKARAVLRDVARVLDMPYEEADSIAKLVPAGPKTNLDSALQTEPKLQNIANQGGVYAELIETGKKLEGLNRHVSTHAAGIVIGKEPLTEYVPLYRVPKSGSISTQYTWEQLEDCGLVKMDFLGLKTLTLLKNAERLIRLRDPQFSIEAIPEDDTATFELLGDGRSACIFQFESSGMQSVLRRARPTKIEDLIALNALYRPGPMENIDQFVDSKNGHIQIQYPIPELEPLLRETYGVIVYQEQVMEIARLVAGYTLGQADILRKAMGKKIVAVMEKEKKTFVSGALRNGFAERQAREIFDLLIPFAGYGFNKAHAAAYSVLAYQTAFLKANHPAEFMAANLTNEIDSTDKLTHDIDECRQMGLRILPPHINLSEKFFSVDDGDIVYGLLGLKNVGSSAVDAILSERASRGPFESFDEMLLRIDLKTVNRKVLETLISAGMFDSFEANRATLAHNLDRMIEFVSKKKKFREIGQASLFDAGSPDIDQFRMDRQPQLTQLERLSSEKEIMGFYFSGHPLDPYRDKWQRSVTLDLSNLPQRSSDREYAFLGVVKQSREIQTRKGTAMAFVQLEDFNGVVELVVFSEAWQRWRELLGTDAVVGITGRVDASRGDPKVVVVSVMEPNDLPESGPSELHVRVGDTIGDEQELIQLRSLLIELDGGACSLFLHAPDPAGGSEVVIKASPQIQVDESPEMLERINELSLVTAVWHE